MSEWNSVLIGEVAQIFNGKTPSKSEQRSHGHPVLKIKDVSDLGEFRGTFASFVDHDLADAYASKRLCEGDTLILNAAHNADYVGSKTFRVQRTRCDVRWSTHCQDEKHRKRRTCRLASCISSHQALEGAQS